MKLKNQKESSAFIGEELPAMDSIVSDQFSQLQLLDNSIQNLRGKIDKLKYGVTGEHFPAEKTGEVSIPHGEFIITMQGLLEYQRALNIELEQLLSKLNSIL